MSSPKENAAVTHAAPSVSTITEKYLFLDTFVCLFVTEEILYSITLVSDQAPTLLVFLTPRQVLLSHPRQQMVWLYWLQDRDSMPNWYTINHPTTLHTHNETQWPTAACRHKIFLSVQSRELGQYKLLPGIELGPAEGQQLRDVPRTCCWLNFCTYNQLWLSFSDALSLPVRVEVNYGCSLKARKSV